MKFCKIQSGQLIKPCVIKKNHASFLSPRPHLFPLKYFSSCLKISNRRDVLEQRETKPLREWYRQTTGYHHLDWSSLIKSAYSQNEANTTKLLSTVQHFQQYIHSQEAQMKHRLNKSPWNFFYFISDIRRRRKHTHTNGFRNTHCKDDQHT